MRQSLRLAGQLVMVGFEGHEASAAIKSLIKDYGLGGVILFARNVDAPEQVAELVRELQDFARDAGHERPLLVAVDQEGGRVARLRAPWTEWPPARTLGRTRSSDLAREMGVALGRELLACGIQLDFAPVLDVDTNPDNPVINDRSFDSDATAVGRLGAALIEGLQSAGVAACGKHFPGLGDSGVDPHKGLATVEHARSRLDAVELVPFRAAIKAEVACIMTAHAVVPELDPDLPATLSAALLDGLLREDMGFSGVIVSDDLEMRGVADHWPVDELAVRSVGAGCDLLLVCEHPDVQTAAVEALVHGFESKELPWKRLEDSERRVRLLKEKYAASVPVPEPRNARHWAGSEPFRALAERIAREAQLA